MTPGLRQTSAAFDVFSATYSESFRSNALSVAARARARALYATHLPRTSLVGDIGCGPGDDSVWLALRGSRVLAVDCSPKMIDEARRAAVQAGVEDRITHTCGDAFAPDLLVDAADGYLDCALVGFGVLNCVPDLAVALKTVSRAVRPGGVIVISTLSSRCTLDLLWHLLYARRIPERWRRSPRTVSVMGVQCPAWYWNYRDLLRSVPPDCLVVDRLAVGCVVPPAYMDRTLRRAQRIRRALLQVDKSTQRWRIASHVCDMNWLVIRRQPEVGLCDKFSTEAIDL